MHGVSAVIIMPADAPRLKIDNTRALGAEVVLYDRATEDRDAIGAALAKSRGLTLIKPFDKAMVIAGQGTTGLEIAEQAAEVATEPEVGVESQPESDSEPEELPEPAYYDVDDL